MSSELTIKESLKLRSVMEISNDNNKFNVAFYQRGYRWKPQQVTQLLQDIDSFTPTHKAPSYFLQALVISRNETNIWNVVDGQQRLTTISLIQEHLNSANLLSLSYNRSSKGTIDGHYKEEARKTIKSWFDSKTPSDKTVFLNKLYQARFLLYPVQREDELAVFGRLNSGKISASDSELVKCVMLTPLLDEPMTVTQARAREWDEIDRALTDNQFFAFFVRRDTWREVDRMAMLFCSAGLCANIEDAKTRNEVFPFLTCVQHEISETSRSEVWQKIYFAYYTLIAWYDDPVMYHAIGWYRHRGDGARTWNMSLDKVRTELTKALTNTREYVQQHSNLDTDKELVDFYSDNDKKWQANDYLLLYNVAFCWRRWPMRYDFHQHRQVDFWSLEHIVARNERDLNENEFLQFSPQTLTKANWPEYEEQCRIGKGDEWLGKQLKDSYPHEDDHNIQNLALLGKDANSSLNNNLFEGKRRLILEWSCSKGNYWWVPPATQAVFFKTILGTDPHTPYWSQPDKQKYVESMMQDVQDFVKAVEGV